MSTVSGKSDGNIVKSQGSLPQSEVILERELEALQSLANLNHRFFPQVLSHSREGGLSITMSRVGTHDLEDVLHEVPSHMVRTIITSMVEGLQILHDQGLVHRDIKPGNFMVEYSHRGGLTGFSGIVDFGMSLRINRKQNELGSLGGTKPYSHTTQTNKKFRGARAHPGQDWFALGRTLAHLLIGGGKDGLESSIESAKAPQIARDAILSCWDKCPQSIVELITFSLSVEAEGPEALDELERIGRTCIQSSQIEDKTDSKFSSFEEAEKAMFQEDDIPDSANSAFQKYSNSRPKRHDLLLIVDSTGSMSGEIEDLKKNLEDVTSSISSKLDLRVDIWSLGDYTREGESQDPVRVVGKRLRFGALRKAITQLSAQRNQHDEAEAYEAALQDAYLTRKWSPRRESTRTIIVVGDSYAHGWLTKSHWSKLIFDSGLTEHPDSPNNREYLRKIQDFEKLHPDVPWWERKEEEQAWKDARASKSTHDHFSGREAFVSRKGRKGYRPNIIKSIEKCTSIKQANIHTLFSGENLVARNFMKYCALMGEGTYTQVSKGELKIALTALFAIADKSLYESFNEEVSSTNPDTVVLNSITSFVLD